LDQKSFGLVSDFAIELLGTIKREFLARKEQDKSQSPSLLAPLGEEMTPAWISRWFVFKGISYWFWIDFSFTNLPPTYPGDISVL